MEASVRKNPWEAIADFLVVRRVTISLFVFGMLLLKDIVTGARPHDTWNLHDPFAMTGLVLVLVGLGIRSWAAGVIKKTKVLATTGPYRLCRHPLYLGSLLMMLGFCIIVSNATRRLHRVRPGAGDLPADHASRRTAPGRAARRSLDAVRRIRAPVLSLPLVHQLPHRMVARPVAEQSRVQRRRHHPRRADVPALLAGDVAETGLLVAPRSRSATMPSSAARHCLAAAG